MSFINCSVIKRIKQDEFKTFSDLVFENMNGKPVYEPFQSAVTDMEKSAQIYQTALIKSKSRAIEAVEAKNVAYTGLYNALVRIAKLMDAAYPMNLHDKLKTDAGFTLNKTPDRQNVTYVSPPTNLQVYNDIRRGVIIVEWQRAENAVTTAFEMQINDGEWRNGVYCETQKMELTYPFGVKLMLRGKTVGPNLLTSGYSLPVEVMVS